MVARVKITFHNSCTLGSKYFGDGFQPSIYLDAYWDSPVFVISDDSALNGEAIEHIKSRVVGERCVFESPLIIDQHVFMLNNIRSHDTITIFDSYSGETIEAKDFQFEYIDTNDHTGKGRFSFEVARLLKTGCCGVQTGFKSVIISDIENWDLVRSTVDGGGTWDLVFVSFIINGVEQITPPETLTINSGNMTTRTGGDGFIQVTNHIAFLNSLIPNYTFESVDNPDPGNLCGGGLKVTYPSNDSWSFAHGNYTVIGENTIIWEEYAASDSRGMTKIINQALPVGYVYDGCGDPFFNGDDTYGMNRFTGVY